MAADQVLSRLSILEHKKSDYKSVAVSCFFYVRIFQLKLRSSIDNEIE